MNKTEQIYNCSIKEFEVAVDDRLKYVSKRLGTASDVKIFLFATLDTEIMLLTRHKLLLNSTRDSDRHWLATTYPLARKIADKLAKKLTRRIRYEKELLS